MAGRSAKRKRSPRGGAGAVAETGPADLKKTSLVLPSALWIKARQRAAADMTDLRTVIIAALEAYLR